MDFPWWLAYTIIVVSSALGGLFAAWCAYVLSKIPVRLGDGMSETSSLIERAVNSAATRELRERIYNISCAIEEGSRAFLFAEYKIMAIFMVMMTVVIFVLLGINDPLWPNCPSGGHTCAWIDAAFSALAFIIGATTSIVSGWIGMRIAVYTNSRTALQAEHGYAESFSTAFRGGIVMGFGLTSVGLLALFVSILLFRIYYQVSDKKTDADSEAAFRALFSAIAPFGLGGSSIALFGRVGGGIFTKAADVGADLVGKVEQNIPEDDPRNPGTIADNVGDNVGDIAGMGSDLFGSFAEATCAALVVSTTSSALMARTSAFAVPSALLFPLVITGAGLIVCILTSFLATHVSPPSRKESIEPCLKMQLLASTCFNTVVMLGLSKLMLPNTFGMPLIFLSGEEVDITWWQAYLAIMTGLWSGLAIGYITEYYTSSRNSPVRFVAEACKTGAATNIINGLALGYLSTIVPCFCIAFSVFASFLLAGCYGVALAALGILSTMAIGLTIDGYGPISDNAGGIAEMAGMDPVVRERTDALDAAGNTTAAIGKGFAIGSAAFVAVALFGAFQTQIQNADQKIIPGKTTYHSAVIVNILDPRTFFGLIVGAMLPYWFSAMTMKSVGTAAMEMVREIQRQFREHGPELLRGDRLPDYTSCVMIATNASLKEMILPGALVVLTPILTGILLGPETLAGLLPGAMASGVMMATSAANTGGAWDNAKKYIEAGMMPGHGKGSLVHHASVIGDTVGDPLKDTSGPALNILVKLMAIISVVFAPVMTNSSNLGGLLFNKLICAYTHRCPVYSAAPPHRP
jgi:inorganic pyrophosphatase